MPGATVTFCMYMSHQCNISQPHYTPLTLLADVLSPIKPSADILSLQRLLSRQVSGCFLCNGVTVCGL